jgi:integrase
MKLTAKSVMAFVPPPNKSDHFKWDEDIPGFALRTRSGIKTLVFQYAFGAGKDRRQHRITLGRVTALNFAEARKQAEQLYAKVRLGHDPAAEKEERKAQAQQTFGAIVEQFLNYQRSKLRPRSYANVARHLQVDARSLHRLPLAVVTRANIATCLEAVRQRTSNTTYNRARSALSAMYSWSISRGLVGNNPVIGTAVEVETARDRVLAPEELRAIWRALPDNHFGAIIRLLMLTGARAGEVGGLRWSEVRQDDHGRSFIELSALRTKNGRPHMIPLSPAATTIIMAQPPRVDSDGKPREQILGFGRKGFSGWAQAKLDLDAAITKQTGKALAPWRIHDLRRSYVTHAAEVVGTEPHIIEAVVNHISGHKAGISGVYNRARYENQKRQALDLWGERLLEWVGEKESNVVSLRA